MMGRRPPHLLEWFDIGYEFCGLHLTEGKVDYDGYNQILILRMENSLHLLRSFQIYDVTEEYGVEKALLYLRVIYGERVDVVTHQTIS